MPDLLGWPEDARNRLLDWGSANFDALGPLNARADDPGPGLWEMAAYAHHLAQTQLPEGSKAAAILDAVARGDIEPWQCPMVIVDYFAPSLDTTTSALGNAIWLFVTHPKQWQLPRRDPARVK